MVPREPLGMQITARVSQDELSKQHPAAALAASRGRGSPLTWGKLEQRGRDGGGRHIPNCPCWSVANPNAPRHALLATALMYVLPQG